MKKENWILLAIALVVIVVTILMIKFLPLWATFLCLGCFVFGILAGWILKEKQLFKKTKDKTLLND